GGDNQWHSLTEVSHLWSLLAEVPNAVLETFCHRSLGASIRVLPMKRVSVEKTLVFGMRCYKEMIYCRIY
uniref:Uncharacterized protein n=1 Tax=Aegilops tauschii subsp. strangulata TaxID=200361 RepID=A0A453BII8_AEGTS